MKHLTNKVLFRPPLFLLLLILAGVTLAPPTVWAGGISFTCGCGMAEGDPTDGLDYSGGDIGGVSVLEAGQETAIIDKESWLFSLDAWAFKASHFFNFNCIVFGFRAQDISEINKVLFMDIDQEGYQ